MDYRSVLAGIALGAAAVLAAQQLARRIPEGPIFQTEKIAKSDPAPTAAPIAKKDPSSKKEDLTEPPPEHCPGVDSEAAGKSDACAGCPNKSICASGAPKKDPGIALIAERLKDVQRKVLVLSGKGGVGKSTVSAQLAFAFSK